MVWNSIELIVNMFEQLLDDHPPPPQLSVYNPDFIQAQKSRKEEKNKE